MLKNLVKNLKPSSTLAINETSRELEKKGKKIEIFSCLYLKKVGEKSPTF